MKKNNQLLSMITIILFFLNFSNLTLIAQDSFYSSKMVRCSGGDLFTLVIDQYGQIWAWGSNSNGQICEQKSTYNLKPELIKTSVRFQQISCGKSQSFALDSTGNIWAWGQNDQGQLGDSTTIDKYNLTQIKTNTKFKCISAGWNHTLAIDVTGNIWAWGNNEYGQLGDGTIISKLSPIQISSQIEFKEISAGYNHSLAIDESGNLWVWGNNKNGQLGDGTTTNTTVPIQINSTLKFKAISAGRNYYGNSAAIDESGKLWVWGSNTSGRLGDGTTKDAHFPINILTTQKFIQVSNGVHHTIVIDELNQIWAWGYNNEGEIGDGGSVYSYVMPELIKKGTSFIQTGIGHYHSMAIDIRGNIWVWGFNNMGQLGTGDKTTNCGPVKLNNVRVPVSEIKLSSSELSLLNGYYHSALIVSYFPSDATSLGVRWTCSDTTKAIVFDNGSIIAKAPGNVAITATSYNGGKTATCSLTIINSITNIKLSETKLKLNIGSSFKIEATIEPFDAVDKKIIWKSNNPSIATANDTGLVNAVSTGITKIWVTANSGIGKSYFEVEVTTPVSGITLSDKEINLKQGSTYSLNATLTPKNPINDTIIWTSSNDTIVSVDSSGFLTCHNPGIASITAKSADGGICAYCKVTVYIPVTGLALAYDTLTIKKDSTFLLNSVFSPFNASDNSINWTSSDVSLVTVDSLGVLKGINKGTAVIKAKTNDGGFTDSCVVNVSTPVSAITIREKDITIKKDSTLQLHALITPSDASDCSIQWISSDESIVKVNSDGFITGIGNGEATIEAKSKDGGLTAICKITVISNVSVANFEKKTFELFPNPLKEGSLTILFPVNVSAVHLKIINSKGQVVYKEDVSGKRNFIIDKNKLLPGIYLIKVNGNKFNATSKLIVE